MAGRILEATEERRAMEKAEAVKEAAVTEQRLAAETVKTAKEAETRFPEEAKVLEYSLMEDAAAVESEGENRRLKEKKEERERREVKKEQKKIVVIQRGVTQREGDEGRVQEERRDDQWESVRRRELLSEGRREAEKLGEEMAAELKAAAKEEEINMEESQKGDGSWRKVKEEMAGVMGYLQRTDQKLQEISNKVEKLREERKRERET